MERGRVRKGSGSVLFLFHSLNDVRNDVPNDYQMTTDYNENKSVDNLHKMDVMGRHKGRHCLGANDVRIIGGIAPFGDANCHIAIIFV